MGEAWQWPYKSTGRVRALVLLALGVVKVATAEQLRQLVLPGTADAQTVRNACKDLRHAGLVESVGKTSRPGKAAQQLWNLTTAGLAAAAAELGRPVREMGGTARDAAKAGAAHALAVSDTIDAFRQSPPLATKPIARRGTDSGVPSLPAQARQVLVRPPGLGHLRGWETEVALPVTGTFATPTKGSLRADAVLTAPEDGVPVLFVEVDNHTEPAAVVARKIERYQKFFQRQVKDHRGRDVAMWSTLWEDSGRGGFPPVALVFAKDVGAEARLNRMKAIRDVSRPCWEGKWQSDHGWHVAPEGEEREGWWSFDGTVPVIATHLGQLKAKGPHGPIWWRFGRAEWQTLADALTNTNTREDYLARDEQRRQEREAARVVEDQLVRDELERWQESWECPSCGTDFTPDTVGEDGYQPAEGGRCPTCERVHRELQAERAAAEDAARSNGILARLRARAEGQ
ncbi:replication-relaxation family protein [Streptomyces sp. NPDC002668]|uniref:replication-relaxation family protein n=1 Tax=Streptomyces sp. NPDC002668 TaxID=3154422 RepID=UPI003332780B